MHAFQPGFFDAAVHALAGDDEGGITYRPGVVAPGLAACWFDALREAVDWKAMRRPMYNRVVDVPRLVGAYWLERPDVPAVLQEVAARVREAVGEPFNAVGLNYYRDGRDSVAPHNDKLHMLVPGHPIAVLSLGAERRMVIRRKQPPRTPIAVDLAPGSLLVMSHASQLHYDHGIPKARVVAGPRISLAFRVRPPEARRREDGRMLEPARPPG